MSKYLFLVKKQLSFLFLFANIIAIKAQSSARWEYIQRYKEIAVEEMKRAGVPASIKLAQGLLESGAGTSSLAKQANNHFGMKCGAEWRGETFYLKDDDYDENGVLKESCFRVFKSPEESYKAHSEFLRDPNKAYRYGFLFRLPVTDYKKWAQGLKQAGYATSPTYDNALISIIEQYKLSAYDSGPSDPGLSDVILVNDVKMTVAKLGQTPAELAERYKVKLKCLMKYNEGIKGANQPLAVNEHIFLQKKRRFFRGGQKTHYVKPGETMYSISQQYGVRLKSLLRKNKMSEGTEAAFGEKLHLRGWPFGRKSPKLRENIGKETPTNPFDEGTGKVPHIDETNQVDPNDLPTQGNKNGNNNGSSNTNTGNNNGTTNNNNTGNNGTNNNTGTTNNPSGNTSSNNGNTNGSGTVTPSNPTNSGGNNSSNNSSSNPTTKPTSTTGSSTTKPSTTTGGGTTTGNPSIPPSTKPSTTTGGGTTTPTSTTGGSTTTKPSTTTGSTTTKPSVPTTTEEPRPSGVQYHIVDKGETLYSIAKRYGMTVDGLKKLNDLPDNNIKLGQKIRLN